MPTNSKSKAKKKAWGWFSKYIRARDCILTTGNIEYGFCFTCGRTKSFKELQAGHFVDSRCNAILFEEDGVHAQCKQCNLFKSGAKDAYTPKMVSLYGQERVDELYALKHTTKEYSVEDYESLASLYKEKYNDLLSSNK